MMNHLQIYKSFFSLLVFVVILLQCEFILPTLTQSQTELCAPNTTYISSVRLLTNDTSQVRVKSSADRCYLVNITDGSQTTVSCSDYGESITADFATGDEDATNTSINSVDITKDEIRFTFFRNDETFDISINNSDSYFNDSEYYSVTFAFWTNTDIYTTFILLQSNNNTDIRNLFCVEFDSESNNDNYNAYYVTWDVSGWQSSYMERLNDLGSSGVYVFSTNNLLSYQVRAGPNGCNTGVLYNISYFNPTTNTRQLSMTRIGSGISIDNRISDDIKGYKWSYSKTLTIFELNTDGSSSFTSYDTISFELSLGSSSGSGGGSTFDDIDLYWGFIISGVVLLLIAAYTGGLYWYSEHRKTDDNNDDDDDYLE